MNDDSNLSAFIGGYFHQDWPVDDSDAAAVVDRYARENLREEVTLAQKEAEALLASGLDEKQLAADLERRGLNYLPQVDGMTHHEWLGFVVKRLETLLRADQTNSGESSADE